MEIGIVKFRLGLVKRHEMWYQNDSLSRDNFLQTSRGRAKMASEGKLYPSSNPFTFMTWHFTNSVAAAAAVVVLRCILVINKRFWVYCTRFRQIKASERSALQTDWTSNDLQIVTNRICWVDDVTWTKHKKIIY